MATTNLNIFDLVEYLIFKLMPNGNLIPINRPAKDLLNTIQNDTSNQSDILNTLFELKTYDEIFDLAKANRKKIISLTLNNDQKKEIRWEFMPTDEENPENGVTCFAVNWSAVHGLVDKIKTENLLFKELILNVLPLHVANDLIAKKAIRPKAYLDASILFTDIVSFSKLAFHLDPVTLIRKLNSCFTIYDDIVEEFGLEKIKTIGDSYMCSSGVPLKKPSHAVDAALGAMTIIKTMQEARIPDPRMAEALDLDNWSIRIGIHSGPCISGVIGYKKFIFDIWGDSVNIASRMESSSKSDKINISEATYERVSDFFDCTYRGFQEVKNIGKVATYFLNRIKPELSQDKDGFVPNLDFKKLYIDKFYSKNFDDSNCSMPKFIKNLI